jgi:hypothetical protein
MNKFNKNKQMDTYNNLALAHSKKVYIPTTMVNHQRKIEDKSIKSTNNHRKSNAYKINTKPTKLLCINIKICCLSKEILWLRYHSDYRNVMIKYNHRMKK